MAISLRCWRSVRPVRRQTLVWPREHGAWGFLLVSLITGAATGLSSTANLPQLLWLTIAAIAAFCLHAPLENSLPASPFRPRERAEWRWVILAGSAYAVTSILALGLLARAGALRLIWKPSLTAAGILGLQAFAKRRGDAGRLLAEVVGAFGLAIVAAAAWATAAGRFEGQALLLWLLNGLFATNQILYVQCRIRQAGSPERSAHSRIKMLFLAVQVLTLVVLIASRVTNVLPSLALLAFLPVLVRGGVWSLHSSHRPLQIYRLGKTELAHVILFGLLLIVGFRVHIP